MRVARSQTIADPGAAAFEEADTISLSGRRHAPPARQRARRRPVARVAVVVMMVMLVFAGGCRKMEKPPPDIRGTIASVTRAAPGGSDDLRGSILVVGARQEDTIYDRAMVSITRRTRILETAGATRKVLDVAALRPGQRVEVRFTGAVRESYPVQATAAEVVILPK